MMTGGGRIGPPRDESARLPLGDDLLATWSDEPGGFARALLFGDALLADSGCRAELPAQVRRAAVSALVGGGTRSALQGDTHYLVTGVRVPLPAFVAVRAPSSLPGETLRRGLDDAVRAARDVLAEIAARDPFARALSARPSLGPTVELLRRVARTRLSVLLLGETGTGKEVLARALHDASGREGAFVAENCGAIPSELLEAELFGVRRGAFTGAAADRIGRVQRAHRGTLFLDEIGDLPASAQVKLLRVLQEREVRPVGAQESIAVDLRVVAATLHDLASPASDSRFRRDLYFRIAGVVVRVPPLADTLSDLAPLAATLLARLADEQIGPGRHLCDLAFARLASMSFRGNVRELDHVLRRAATLSRGPVIDDETLAPCLAETAPGGRNLEERAILDALLRARGVKTDAARLLGWTRQKLYRRLAALGLDDARGASTQSR